MNAKKTIQTVGLVTKYNYEPVDQAAKGIKQWLEERGVTVWQSDSTLAGVDITTLPKLDLVLVLGGDGTIISVARRLLALQAPVAGVNFGKVGFLAELTNETWAQALEKVLQEGVKVEERVSLHYTLQRQGRCLIEGDVINDVVITRGKTTRLVRLDLSLEGEPLMQLRSDGLIMSTPTGSTGYACSAGGSLLAPTLDAYIVASICPFLNVFSPLVLESNAVFGVHLPDPTLDLYLTLDGQETIALETDDILQVQGASQRFLLATMGQEGYVERLRRAGFIHTQTAPYTAIEG